MAPIILSAVSKAEFPAEKNEEEDVTESRRYKDIRVTAHENFEKALIKCILQDNQSATVVTRGYESYATV